MKTQARILVAVLGSAGLLLSCIGLRRLRQTGSVLPVEIIPSEIYDPLGLVSECERAARQSRGRLQFHGGPRG